MSFFVSFYLKNVKQNSWIDVDWIKKRKEKGWKQVVVFKERARKYLNVIPTDIDHDNGSWGVSIWKTVQSLEENGMSEKQWRYRKFLNQFFTHAVLWRLLDWFLCAQKRCQFSFKKSWILFNSNKTHGKFCLFYGQRNFTTVLCCCCCCSALALVHYFENLFSDVLLSISFELFQAN